MGRIQLLVLVSTLFISNVGSACCCTLFCNLRANTRQQHRHHRAAIQKPAKVCSNVDVQDVTVGIYNDHVVDAFDNGLETLEPKGLPCSKNPQGFICQGHWNLQNSQSEYVNADIILGHDDDNKVIASLKRPHTNEIVHLRCE